MEQDDTIVAMLPIHVADALVGEGKAVSVPTSRTGIPVVDVLVTGLAVLTAPVVLAQAPSTAEDIARRLIGWRNHVSLGRDPVLSVDAKGPTGRVSIRLTADVSETDVTRLIALVLPRHTAQTSE